MYPRMESPRKIASVEIKNPIVLAPMNTRLCDNGFVTEALTAFFLRRARGGVGLIIVGAVMIDGEGANPRAVFVDDDNKIEGLQKVTSAVIEAGSKIFAQIHGNKLNPSTGEEMTIDEMTSEDIKTLIEKYIQGALRAKEGGFQGVELHGTHGFLLSRFLSPVTNHRQDEYGGNHEKRLRIVEEIYQGIRDTAGKDYPIGIRISGKEEIDGGLTEEEGIQLAKDLEKMGFDYISVSIHPTKNRPLWPRREEAPGSLVPLAVNIQKVVKIPVMTVGKINTPTLIESILQDVAFVSIGRGLIADPDFVLKAMGGDEILTCTCCNTKCRITTGIGCAINPEAGREWEML